MSQLVQISDLKNAFEVKWQASEAQKRTLLEAIKDVRTWGVA